MSSLTPAIIITLCCWIVCDAQIQYEVEGQNAQLAFPYPCDTTKVTLRHGYKEPFYDSTDLESTIIPARYLLTRHNDTARNGCSVHLTIKPISRDDEGTFILTAYKNGIMLPDYPRIGLRVAYPPGKASCELSNDYDDGELVSLQCTASVGTVAGQIVCYQNGTRLTSETSPKVSNNILNQAILASKADSVYCCSSAIDRVKDISECKDYNYLWNPLHIDTTYDMPEPCLSTFPSDATKGSTQNSHAPLEKITCMCPPTSLKSNTTLNRESGNSGNSKYLYMHVLNGILILVVLVSLVLNYIQYKRNSNFQHKYHAQKQVLVDDHHNENNIDVCAYNLESIEIGETQLSMC